MSDFSDIEIAPGVTVSECTLCWALVDIDRHRLHREWHVQEGHLE